MHHQITKTYSDLIVYETFEERLSYLSLLGVPAEETFDQLRYINQEFYRSRLWKKVRESVISRDLGYDLGIPGLPVIGKVLVHHMNVLTVNDILNRTDMALDPEYLITVSHDTHQAIHYGSKVRIAHTDRFSGDTKLW